MDTSGTDKVGVVGGSESMDVHVSDIDEHAKRVPISADVIQTEIDRVGEEHSEPRPSYIGVQGNEDDVYKCPICISLLVDPFVTPCGHAFCHTCIMTHLNHAVDPMSATCPQCGRAGLSKDRLNPSFSLSKVVGAMAKKKKVYAQDSSPYLALKHMIRQSRSQLNGDELGLLLKQIREYKDEADRKERTGNLDLLLHFLHQSKEEKAKRLELLRKEIECLDSDIHVCQQQDHLMHRSRSVKSMLKQPQDDDDGGLNDKEVGQKVERGEFFDTTAHDNDDDNSAEEPAQQQQQQGQFPPSSDVNIVGNNSNQMLMMLNGVCSKKRKRIASQFEDLQSVYLKLRSNSLGGQHSASHGELEQQQHTQTTTTTTNNNNNTASGSTRDEQKAAVCSGDPLTSHNQQRESSSGLQEFTRILGTIAHSNRLRILAEIPRPPLRNLSSIVSSVEFDRHGKLFATAGVSKRISIFDHGTIIPLSMRGVQITHCPVVEMVTRSKLSCLSWNKFVNSELASTDYEGVLNVWDTTTGDLIHEYEAHSKRIWSVDHCCADPALITTGSDDCFVKVWSTKSPSAIAQFDLKANVCAVKWNPNSPYEIAVGSADHSVYLYDLRKYDTFVRSFSGHKKAVSYVRWSGNDEIVSASTDSTLRLWNVRSMSMSEERLYKGHVNEKNFVGLAIQDDLIACGSENHEVCVYYKPLSKPITRLTLPSPGGAREQSNEHPFISAVSWHPGKKELLAATSQGSVFILSLEGEQTMTI
jgi:E3 ubiquitin-protein ligase RFWD2